MSNEMEQIKKVKAVSHEISKHLESKGLTFGEALSALSFALIVSAKVGQIDKATFMTVVEADWDSLGLDEPEEETTH